MRLGLRIDVDTFRGTRFGVPALCRILAERDLRATFFFTVGPDNMGRHLWRLLRPTFLAKMLRTRAGSLYGWDILLRGTLGPGPMIGDQLASCMTLADRAGHEVGVHAWDHHRWQMKVETLGPPELQREIMLAFDRLADILGRVPDCSAVAGWRCTDDVLDVKERFPFRYNSDCRGRTGIFRPRVGDRVLEQPQIPVTLPTWDEVAGRIPDDRYNDHLFDLMRPGEDEVLTVHAEAEGMSKSGLFEMFLDQAAERGWEIVPLGSLLPDAPVSTIGRIAAAEIPGREGWVAMADTPAVVSVTHPPEEDS